VPRLSDNPVIDTSTKLVGVAVLMFAFVFVVMVPLYDVLCDALGINGKTSEKPFWPMKINSGRLMSAGNSANSFNVSAKRWCHYPKQAWPCCSK